MILKPEPERCILYTDIWLGYQVKDSRTIPLKGKVMQPFWFNSQGMFSDNPALEKKLL